MQSIFSREPILPPRGEAITKIRKARKRMKIKILIQIKILIHRRAEGGCVSAK